MGNSASTRLLRALGAEDPFIEGAFALKYEPIADKEDDVGLLEEALNFVPKIDIEQPAKVSQLLSMYAEKEKIPSILTLRMVGTRSDIAYENTPSADVVLQAKKDKLAAEKANFLELRRAYDFPFEAKRALVP